MPTGIGAVLNTARVEPGASVLVIGCGGVGLSVIMGASLISAWPIVAVDLVPSKLEPPAAPAQPKRSLQGSDLVEAVRELTDGRGVDYAFEAIGLAGTIETAFDAVAPGGTAVVVGQVPDGVRASFDPFVLSDRERRSRAATTAPAGRRSTFGGSSTSTWRKLDLDLLLSQTLPLESINEAFASMSEGAVARSVIVYG